MAQASSSSYLGVYHARKPPGSSVASSSRTSFDVYQQPRREVSSKNVASKDRAFANRNHHFVMSNGVRRHGKPKEVAPYPLCYSPDALNIDSIDHAALWQTRGGPSDFDFKEPPARSLDLGCGHASWIMQTARVWKSTQFVGFDLVNIQPDLKHFPDLADRVRWIHGNFLTDPLPFEDGYFDHVYARGLEMAVPEDQWDFVISEIVRVLRPGGAVDFLVNDILFPYVPMPRDERLLLHKAPPAVRRPPPPIHPDPVKPLANGHRSSSKTISSRAQQDGAQTEPEDGPGTSTTTGSGFVSRAASSSALSKTTSKTSSSSDPSRKFHDPAPPPVPPLPFGRPSMTDDRRPDPPRHIHEWLEELFYNLFERRFINLTPTRILPNYLNIHLTAVTAGQPVKMPMIKPGTIYAALEDDYDGSTAGSTTDDDTKLPVPKSPEQPAPSPAPPTRKSADAVPSILKRSGTPPPPPVSSSRLSLQTTSLPTASNPPSSSSFAPSSAAPSPNIIIDEIESNIDPHDRRSNFHSTPGTTASVSAASSPPSSFSFSPKDSPQQRPLLNRPVTAPSGSSKEKSKAIVHTGGQGQVAAMVFDLQEHVIIGKMPSETVLVDSLADVAGRQRAVSTTNSEMSSSKSETSTPKAEKLEAPPTKKRRRKPLKFVAASQSLTMMLIRGYKIVLACKEDMWEELLLQKGLLEVSKFSKDPSAKATITQLRTKFDAAFEHYIADMREVAAINDGLVHALGMKRPAKVKPTPAQEMDEQMMREKRVEKTLGLIGWAYRPRQSVVLADGRFASTSLEGQQLMRGLLPDKGREEDKIPEEEERPLFRSTRVFAGFKRTK